MITGGNRRGKADLELAVHEEVETFDALIERRLERSERLLVLRLLLLRNLLQLQLEI